MSPLQSFLDEVDDPNKARIENVDGKRVLYVVMAVFRQHISTVTLLIHYHREVDYGVLMSRNKKMVEIRPLT
jgi:hypothetical protein